MGAKPNGTHDRVLYFESLISLQTNRIKFNEILSANETCSYLIHDLLVRSDSRWEISCSLAACLET